MPYDDTDVKKMIRHQMERKVGFSRHKRISVQVATHKTSVYYTLDGSWISTKYTHTFEMTPIRIVERNICNIR